MHTLFKAAVATSLIAATAASASPDDLVEITHAALGSGSERMAIFALSDPGFPLPVRIQAGQISGERGYAPENGFRKVDQNVDIAPILTYDSDINGGSGKDGFRVGGIDFVIPEDERRKSGIVLGASFSANARYTLARQTVADVAGWGSFAWSPKHDISKVSAGMSACVTRQFERDLYASACAAYGLYQTDLKNDESLVGELSINKLFGSANAIHDIGIGVSLTGIRDKKWDESYEQARFRIGGETLFPSGDMVRYRATFGEKVEGEKVRTLGLDVSYVTTMFDQTVIIGAGYNDYAGARWLGRDVREESFSVSAGVIMKNGLDVRVEYVETSSGSQISDGSEVFFDVKYNF